MILKIVAMAEAAAHPTAHPLFNPDLADAVATHDAWMDAAASSGVGSEGMTAIAALRNAADFLEQAACEIAEGKAVSGPEAVQWFRWGIMKAVEFNSMLPEEVRGELSAECFHGQRRS
jgi:hypothetical protein